MPLFDENDIRYPEQLLPDADNLYIDDVVKTYPTYTYKLHWEQGRIRGMTDGLEAIKQAVFKMFSTVAGAHPIYSPNYGLYVEDLIGQDHEVVKSEIKARLKRQMIVDDRIQDIRDFQFKINGDMLSMTFKVVATSGDVTEVSGEVAI